MRYLTTNRAGCSRNTPPGAKSRILATVPLVEFHRMRHTVVIVGAGFCGTVLAANLLRRPPPRPTDIVLIERRREIGRGLAYADRDFPYLLNVPAARLSADSKDPLQFLHFARRSLPQADAEDFLPRALYGDYLQDILRQAENCAPGHVRLMLIHGEARRVIPHSGEKPLAVDVADREPIVADRVVLALGNPPSVVLPWAGEVRNHPAYRHDPWVPARGLGAQHSVLIVGNGLTMADVALSLTQDADRAPTIHTISRRGLIPQLQATFRPSAVQGDGQELLACATSIRRVLAVSRDMAREVADLGGDWREVVTFIRNLAPRIWQRLPETEHRRFLRHLHAYWDVHRHRLPPQIGARILDLRRSGKLRINAGRIQRAVPLGEQLRVVWQPRGQEATVAMVVDAIVNATGPDYALKRSSDPLVKSLLAQGLLSEDGLSLGLRTAAYGACVDARGSASDRLFYLGPMLRADHWEATAATELRDHAERLAEHLVNRAG
jgi:uncharacterized NAD(P)/FAD-binding protein YdhS